MSELVERVARAIAEQRRNDDESAGFPPPPGDDGPFLPMDIRAARAAIRAARAAIAAMREPTEARAMIDAALKE